MPVDFASAHVIADPFPSLRQALEESPVEWNTSLDAWCVYRHADVQAAFMDPRFSSDRIRPFAQANRRRGNADLDHLGEVISLWMVFNDPPTHTRLRKLAQKAFTPAAIEALRPAVHALVHRLLDRVEGRDEFDFVEEVAGPLPAMVIATMLGVPLDRVDDLKRWSDDLAQFVLASRVNPEKYTIAARSLREMTAFFASLVAERRLTPGDTILDRLIDATEDGESLSEGELLSNLVLLLFAGHETTTHFFTNGLRALLLHPDQLARVRAGDADLVRNAIAEMLRWDGPSLALGRVLAEDLSLGGHQLRAGQRAYLFAASANRDPRMFPDPDTFDVRRPEARRHVTFGHGIHMCLGIHLARMEGEVAFPILLERLGAVEAAVPDQALEWTDTIVIRGARRLPLRRANPTRRTQG